MARSNTLTRNQSAFLDMLAWSEGTSTSKWTKDDGYDIVVDGINSPKRFTDYKHHPGIKVLVNKTGLESTAAGRYQTLLRFANPYIKLLKLPDFGPESQDRITNQQIKEFRALAAIELGQIEVAIGMIRELWASLPGGSSGQHQNQITLLVAQYQKFGGTLAQTR